MPESQEKEQKAPENAKAAPQLTDAYLQDIVDHPEKMADLDSATRKNVLEALDLKPGAEKKAAQGDDAKSQESKPEGEKPAEKEPAAQEPEKKPPTEQEVRAARRRAQELADESNRLEQKEKTLRERLAKATKGLEDAKADADKVKKPSDFLEDSHQEAQQKTIERLVREVEILKGAHTDSAKDELQAVEAKLSRTKEASTFAHLEDLQDHYEGLRTKVPLSTLHEKYSEWVASVVELTGVKAGTPDATPQKLAEMALEKWNSDPALQAKSKPPEESDKLNILLAAHHKTARSGGSLRANLLEVLDDEKILETVVQKGRQDAAKEAARSTVDALKKPNTEIQTLSPAEGAAKPESAEKSKEANIQFMEYVYQKQHSGGRLSPDEFARLKQVRLELAGVT